MGRDDGDPYRLRSDLSVQPRHAVITALAAEQNRDRLDLETPLYESLDPEALDSLLLHRPETDVSVTFSISDVTVTVWVEDEEHILVEVTDRTGEAGKPSYS